MDVATYKAEFLSHYWEGKLRPRHAYAFGWIDKWAHLASIAPEFANLLTRTPIISSLAKMLAGVSQQRPIPAFAPETFKAWFERRGVRNQGSPRVILWPDTFNNYFLPQTAQAAVEVLESAGFQVVVRRQHLCCGRPLYDYGFLSMAKSYLQRIIATLADEIAAGTPFVVLEPSCCSVFRDEMGSLLPDLAEAKKLKESTFTLAEFIQKDPEAFQFSKLNSQAIVQGHCHHKAVMRLSEEKSVMDRMGLDYKLLESGCCGMAGSFGYEADKFDISNQIGERVLLPEVRRAASSTLIIADGFSCKSQIEHATKRRALHLAEVLQLAMHAQ